MLPVKGRERDAYLTAPECQALIAFCSPILRPVVVMALHTGMRKGELLGLRWRCVDAARDEIYVESANEKAARGRVVPMTATLKKTFDAMRASRPRPALDGSDPVFTMGDGSPMLKGALRGLFEDAAARCEGIPIGKRNRVTFHVLRHTAASLMVAAGVPLFDVAKILGHSTLAVTMRYAHFAPEAGRSAVVRLGAALDGAAAQSDGLTAGAASSSGS